MTEQINVYLAGPTVFLQNAVEIGEAKKRILEKYDMKGHFPFDNEVNFSKFPNLSDVGFYVGKMNFQMMDNCDTLIADLTPFHGPSADVGTYGECLYMFGKGKMVNGYSNDTRLFSKRVVDDHYHGQVTTQPIRGLVGHDNLTIENFDLFDNLMLPSAIKQSNGIFLSNDVASDVRYTDLACFVKVAQQLRAAYDALKL